MLERARILFDEYFLNKSFELYLDEYNNYIETRYDKTRTMPNFLTDFLEFTKEAESPAAFLRWSAIACIGAVLRDNVYIDANFGRVYPNLYVILVARSGACRKGLPLKVTKGLISKVNNTKIIDGRTSIQAVVAELAKNYTMQTPGGKGYVVQGASGLLYTEELAAFMVDDKATIPILTDLYDYREEWTNHLKSSDTERLKNVCLSMIAASNETFLKEVYTKAALYGGLLGRTIIVYEQKRRHKNAGIRRSTSSVTPEQLIEHLHYLAKLKGPVTFDEGASKAYEDWYNSIEDEAYEGKSGVEARIHTTALKVSLCLAAADKNFNLIIKERHVTEAIELCLGILQNYKFLTMGAGQSKISAPGTTVLTELLRAPNHELSRKQILSRLWGEVDALTLDQIMNTMEGGELISIVVGGKDGTSYRLTERCIELYKQNADRTKRVVESV
jgi:hypothetical protein